MYTIQQIEDKLIEMLAGLDSPLGVRTIKSYQGELEADDIKKLIALFPAIFVVYGGSAYKQHGSRKVEVMSFHFFFCDKSLRAEEEARRGGANNPGAYSMMDKSRDLLCGKVPLENMHPLEAIRQAAVWFGGGISVYGAQYETAQNHLYPSV